jgi:hypothetical protein
MSSTCLQAHTNIGLHAVTHAHISSRNVHMHDAKNESIRSSQVRFYAGDIAKQAAEAQKGLLKDAMKGFDEARQAFEDARQALAQAAEQV